jgi:hypothetical protein
MNTEALGVMHNAKTGYRNVKNFLGAAIGVLSGGNVLTGNPVSAVASFVVPVIGARAFNRWVTSPQTRARIVEAMQRTKPHTKPVVPPKLVDSLVESIKKAAPQSNKKKD